jgi:hypothetical protein
VAKLNTTQFHQAHGTPFGSGYLARSLGHQGDIPLAARVLQSHLPDIPIADLMLETIHFLHALSQPCPTITTFPWLITLEEFICTSKGTLEDASISPSSTHVGYYKAILKHQDIVHLQAILKHQDIVHLQATMISLPFHVKILPQRWTPVNSCCHHLWIIALLESNFNEAERILISCSLIHHLEAIYGTLEVTYGHFSVVLYPLYVTRQRCFFELPFWNLLYHLIVSFLDPTSILFCLLITPCQNLWCILCG